jgi:hypothetical protein
MDRRNHGGFIARSEPRILPMDKLQEYFESWGSGLGGPGLDGPPHPIPKSIAQALAWAIRRDFLLAGWRARR